jgi:hypothetical protein
MGRVHMGGEEIDGRIYPIIRIEVGDVTVDFKSSFACDSWDHSREVCMAVLNILSGEKKGMVYDRNGNAHKMGIPL